ncbi:hypothetical protein [Terrihalobacillus insolitus]|uniref:hypothetical protein n=1 Tax=Terrihalobacillus insolitus TaxID=2950438 RepID=UPI0023422C2D|nr:hypothetical protein [Terrihalobacillus insolitus]MDC3414252.1 hypothetical protein [Terrihalobacillus insolitus]
MKVNMSKSVLVKNAWKLSNKKAKALGGKAVEYISYGFKKAWEMYFEFTGKKRSSEKKAEQNVDWSQVKQHGRMTEKQESFIASLLRKKSSNNPVAQAFNVSSLRGRISKQQASELISELLAA